MNTTVSFPGLGIGEFTVDRVAFELFGKPIYWYGVIIMLGMVAAFIHTIIRSKREGFTTDDVMDLGIFTVLFGVLGARLYYVLTTLDTHEYKNFIDVIAVWEGGLAIYGGIIAGGTALVLTAAYKKINPLKVMDAVGPGVMIAQAIGRWGNFMNGEAFGYEVPEDSLLYPFRMGLLSGYTETGSTMHYYHPTFLYESLWNLTGFILICFLYRKKKFNGQMALMYLSWYGFGRFFIEGLRTDSLYVGPFRISQVVGLFCFVAGVTLMVVGSVLTRNGKLDKWLTVRWAEPVPAGGEAVPAEGEAVAENTDEGETETESVVENETETETDENEILADEADAIDTDTDTNIDTDTE